MHTASYYSFKGAGRVGISRGTPRGVPAGYRKYAPLAPGAWLWEIDDEAAYRERYFAQLNALDPARVIADLYKLAGDGNTPVILCFCNLAKAGQFCHRTMVAEWITDRTGIAVTELTLTAILAIRKSEQLTLGV